MDTVDRVNVDDIRKTTAVISWFVNKSAMPDWKIKQKEGRSRLLSAEFGLCDESLR
jgi:hypothetical protein